MPGFDAITDSLKNYEKQTKFAVAKALTQTAFQARNQARDDYQKKFTVRTNFPIKGIRAKPANKKDDPIQAEVFSIDWYLADHETGQSRVAPKSGLRTFEIPNVVRELTGTPENKRIPKKYKAQTIVDKIDSGRRPTSIAGNSPFLIRRGGRSNKRRLFVAVRTSKKRLPIRILYVLQPDNVRIKKNEWFFPAVNKVYRDQFPKNYEKALLDAIKTAF